MGVCLFGEGSPTGIEESLLTSQEALLGVSNFAEKLSGL